jgi:hypothetical protein
MVRCGDKIGEFNEPNEIIISLNEGLLSIDEDSLFFDLNKMDQL